MSSPETLPIADDDLSNNNRPRIDDDLLSIEANQTTAATILIGDSLDDDDEPILAAQQPTTDDLLPSCSSTPALYIKMLQNKLATQQHRIDAIERSHLVERRRLEQRVDERQQQLDEQISRHRAIESTFRQEREERERASAQLDGLKRQLERLESIESATQARLDSIKDSVFDASPCSESHYASLKSRPRKQLTVRELVSLRLCEATRNLEVRHEATRARLDDIEQRFAALVEERCRLEASERDKTLRCQELEAELNQVRARLHCDDRRLGEYDELVEERDRYRHEFDAERQLVVDIQPKFESLALEVETLRSTRAEQEQRTRLLQSELDYQRQQADLYRTSASSLETASKGQESTIARLRAQVDSYQTRYVDIGGRARHDYESKLTGEVERMRQSLEQQVAAARQREQEQAERQLESLRHDSDRYKTEAEKYRALLEDEQRSRHEAEQRLQQAIERYNWDVSTLEVDVKRYAVDLQTARVQLEATLESERTLRATLDRHACDLVDAEQRHFQYRAKAESELASLCREVKEKEARIDGYRVLDERLQAVVTNIGAGSGAEGGRVLSRDRLGVVHEAVRELHSLKGELRMLIERKADCVEEEEEVERSTYDDASRRLSAPAAGRDARRRGDDEPRARSAGGSRRSLGESAVRQQSSGAVRLKRPSPQDVRHQVVVMDPET